MDERPLMTFLFLVVGLLCLFWGVVGFGVGYVVSYLAG